MKKKKILEISKHSEFAKKVIKPFSKTTTNHNFKNIFWHKETQDPIVKGNHFSRKLEDLIWRYEEHPYFKYLTFKKINQNSANSYVVLRSEINKSIKILHVMDILGDENSYKSSIEFIEDYATENGFWAI